MRGVPGEAVATSSAGVRRNKYGDVQLFEWASLVIVKPCGLYSTTF
jgi:hypothetical protein